MSTAGVLRRPYTFDPSASLNQRPLLASSFHEATACVPYTELPLWAGQALAAALPAWAAVKGSPAQMRASQLDQGVLKVQPALLHEGHAGDQPCCQGPPA